ncbi:MAG: permease [Pseudomonadota bacterium]|nr:permease [Pseudomonadota bacterium]
MFQPSKGIAKFLGGWLFLLAVGGIYGLVSLFNPAVVAEAGALFQTMALRVLPILALVFVLLFFAGLFLQPAWLAQHLGRAGGFGGWAFTIIFGVLSVGPLYAWYPLLGDLKAKGMSGALIATFLYSRSLKLPLLPLMVHYFGLGYTVALSVGIVVFSVASGLLMQTLAGIDDAEQTEGR